MKIRLFFTDRERAAEVNELRMQEYGKASGFNVDLGTLRWKTSDDESFVMVMEREGQLIATMRGEVIDDMKVLEQKLECPWTFPMEVQFPVLLLSRAATLSSERSAGLNLVLRYWFLRFAQARGIATVIGTFVANSPREQTLRDMGYQFFENKLGWQQSTYRSLRPVHVVALDMATAGSQALRYCEEKLEPQWQENIFAGPFPALKIVRNL